MDKETLKRKSYRDLRLFISKTNIVGYTKLSKMEMIDLIMLQHPYRFTESMKAVQPNYIYDLIANNKYEDPADEFTSPIIKPKPISTQTPNSNTIDDDKFSITCGSGENENKKIYPLANLKYVNTRPLTDKEIIEKEKLKQGILTFN